MIVFVKKPITVFTILLIIATASSIIVSAVLFYLLQSVSKFPCQKSVLEEQLREIDSLRGDAKILTEEEIAQQVKELDFLRKNQKASTEKDIGRQLEELEKLRNK